MTAKRSVHQDQATLIVGRKLFKITSAYSVTVTVGVLGPFEMDDLIDSMADIFEVQAQFLSSVNGYSTYLITAPNVPTLDRAVTFLEESGNLQEPS